MDNKAMESVYTKTEYILIMSIRSSCHFLRGKTSHKQLHIYPSMPMHSSPIRYIVNDVFWGHLSSLHRIRRASNITLEWVVETRDSYPRAMDNDVSHACGRRTSWTPLHQKKRGSSARQSPNDGELSHRSCCFSISNSLLRSLQPIWILPKKLNGESPVTKYIIWNTYISDKYPLL